MSPSYPPPTTKPRQIARFVVVPAVKSRFKQFIANIIGLDGNAAIVVNLPSSSDSINESEKHFVAAGWASPAGVACVRLFLDRRYRSSIAVRSTPIEEDPIKKKNRVRGRCSPANVVCVRPSPHDVRSVKLPKVSTGIKTINPRRVISSKRISSK